MIPRRIDYVIERLGNRGWWANALSYHPARRFPSFYLIGCGADKNIIKRLWFYGFDDSEECIALKLKIIDELFQTTKDMPS